MNTNQPKPHLGLAEALRLLPRADGKRWITVFRHGSLDVEIYAPRGSDEQTPHSRDEVYVVAQGSGVFNLTGVLQPVRPGDFLFVKAGDSHRFEQFSGDFAVWVFFYGPEGGEEPSAT